MQGQIPDGLRYSAAAFAWRTAGARCRRLVLLQPFGQQESQLQRLRRH